MKHRGLVAALLSATLLFSCSTLSNQKQDLQRPKFTPAPLIITGFYDKGETFIVDTDGDGILDTKLFYEMILGINPKGPDYSDIFSDYLNTNFILKYDHSEPFVPASKKVK